jgi:hypothetical protein
MGILIMSSTIITMPMILTLLTGLTVSTVRSFTAHIIHAVCFMTHGIMILGTRTTHGDMATTAPGDTVAGTAHIIHLGMVGTAHGIHHTTEEVTMGEVTMEDTIIIMDTMVQIDMTTGNAVHHTAT